MQYPEPIARLMDSYMKLPGIGAKTAARLAFFSMEMPEEEVMNFANALISCKRDLTMCSVCGNITQEDPCDICQDASRDRTKILVVEDSRDVMSLERMKEYKGLYHVLHGVLSPMEGTGPDDINVASLIQRLQDPTVEEVIIATNATAEGEATAMYLSRLIKPAGIKVTRLAHGLAVGSDIEYADEMTLFKAIEGRREL
ncbi:recombination mediator RecR [uncultured Granulicatella sp.]|uniref:recombination mediator RecR n=1 Tax=uncultured Granulicatella sp. TaxID=316089 RepID=UPI0028E31286|nr:recombination mediator RecR [uncultured Granulicatella sp.]